MWRARCTHLLQDPDERGEVARGLDRVDVLDRHRFTFNPLVDSPQNQGVLATRATLRDRNRDVDGK
jgi:hypothetical protein